MNIQQDFELQSFNTLAVPAKAEFFCRVSSTEELCHALRWAQEQQRQVHLLGGGSNVVLSQFIPGLVIRMDIRGRQILSQTHAEVVVKIGAGEDWHQLVEWTLANGFFGLENLALIPGTVGAAPVQNIGAYGVEISRFVERVEGLMIPDADPVAFTAAECEFAYRDSAFKSHLRSRVAITAVVLRLSLQPQPQIFYPALQDALRGETATPEKIFSAVCHIRRSKLPDPAVIPNCGSFFKNPVVPWDLYLSLVKQYPSMPSYDAHSGAEPVRKLAAAWLIDQAGWKGKAEKGVKVHEHQALVLTNPAKLSANVVLELAAKIRVEVQQKFGVSLEMEPQLIGA